MTPLSERLKARLAFDQHDNRDGQFDHGRAFEHARTAPVIAAMLEGVEALESAAHSKHRPGYCKICDALARLREALDGVK